MFNEIAERDSEGDLGSFDNGLQKEKDRKRKRWSREREEKNLKEIKESEDVNKNVYKVNKLWIISYQDIMSC